MNNVHKLTEGAVLLAVFTVLLLITLYIPVIGVAVNLFLALPFMMYSARNGWKRAAIFTVAAVLLSMIVGSLLAIPLALGYGLTGVVMGSLIKANKSRFVVYTAGSLVFLGNLILQYAIAVALFQINFIEEMLTAFRESIEMSSSMLERMGQEPDEAIMEQFETAVTMVETLMPSLLVMASFIVVFFIMLVSIPILKRFGINVEKWKPFRELTLPKSILWYYLISMIASMVMRPEEGTYWYWALANLVYVLQFLMVLQGFAFIFYYSHYKGFSKAVPIIAVVLALLMPLILYIVRILGIIDLGFDLRNRFFKKK
ncbi:YybS family protein [Mesobacillus harenae]|uniref:YybS family protein n=1 Tax=Mesobacillus harenae TaxID=2213203 RepID=UPI001580AEB8|nr:YybS family protein [Mesobacillus harenae]